MTVKRIAVIGAGPSGLAVLRAFGAARKEGKGVPETSLLRKHAAKGGL